MLARAVRTFVGYDVFISYAHRDALAYATVLESLLTDRGLVVFRDSTEMPPGARLDPTITAALRRTRMLVVLTSDGALGSAWVPREIGVFEASGGPVVLIDLGGALERASWRDPDRVEEREEDGSWQARVPSSRVVDRVVASADFDRSNTAARRIATYLLLLVLGLVGLAASQYDQTRRERDRANAGRLAALAQNAIERDDWSTAAHHALRAVSVAATDDARAALRDVAYGSPHLASATSEMDVQDGSAAVAAADGTLLAVSGQFSGVHLWSAEAGWRSVEGIDGANALAIGTDGAVWAVSLDAGLARIDAGEARVVRTFGLSAAAFGLAVHPIDGSVWVGDIEGRVYRQSGRTDPAEVTQVDGAASALAFTPEAARMLIVSETQGVLVFDDPRSKPLQTLPVAAEVLWVDEDRLFTGDRRGELVHWSLGAVIEPVARYDTGHDLGISALYARGEDVWVGGFAQGRLERWDLRSRMHQVWRGHRGGIRGVAPRGRDSLITIAGDGLLTWSIDPARGAPLRRPIPGWSSTDDMVWSSDGDTLVALVAGEAHPYVIGEQGIEPGPLLARGLDAIWPGDQAVIGLRAGKVLALTDEQPSSLGLAPSEGQVLGWCEGQPIVTTDTSLQVGGRSFPVDRPVEAVRTARGTCRRLLAIDWQVDLLGRRDARRLQHPDTEEGLPWTTAAWSPFNQLVATATVFGGEIHLWSAKTGQPLGAPLRGYVGGPIHWSSESILRGVDAEKGHLLEWRVGEAQECADACEFVGTEPSGRAWRLGRYGGVPRALCPGASGKTQGQSTICKPSSW